VVAAVKGQRFLSHPTFFSYRNQDSRESAFLKSTTILGAARAGHWQLE
jgi:hypothetical protein